MRPAHPVIPDRVLGYAAALAGDLAAASGGRLRATYLHGSAVLGGWVPDRSDVDVLFVVADDVAGPALTAMARVLAAAGPGCPGRELECSAVTVAAAREPRAPWPYLLHVVAGPDAQAAKVHIGAEATGDRDLVMHYAVCREAGWPVVGPPPRELIGSIGTEAIIGYLADEMDWGLAHAPEAYSVLNACRAMIFLTDHAIVSKIAGAETALRRGIGPVHLIRRALGQQRGELPDQPPSADAISYVLATAAALRGGVAARPDDRL
jgi:streptomycin 3"-adenylyltransferase